MASDEPVTEMPRRRVLRYWTLEVGSMLLILGIMGTIIGLLVRHDGQELSSGDYLGLNLTTIIALLSTILRGAIVAVTAEIVSQTKWAWFVKRPHRLLDLQRFDSASRGIWGSFRLIGLLLARGKGSLAGLSGLMASLVVVVSFAVGPFTQQALKTAPCIRDLENAKASLPVAYYIGHGEEALVDPDKMLMAEIKGLIIQAVTNPRSADFAIRPSCETGNCTFPDHGTGITYSSLGICNNCSDSTSLVDGPYKNGTVLWKCEGGDDRNMSIIRPYAPPFRTGFDDAVLLDITAGCTQSLYHETPADVVAGHDINFLAMKNATCPLGKGAGGMTCPPLCSNSRPCEGDVDFVAMSCSLYPCLKSYQGSVENGILREEVVSTKPLYPLDPFDVIYSNFSAFNTPCILDGEGGTGPFWFTRENISSVEKVTRRQWPSGVTRDPVSQERFTAPSACLFQLDGNLMTKINEYLREEVLSAQCFYNGGYWGHLGEEPTTVNCTNDQQWWLNLLYDQGGITSQNISTMMDGIALALTNKFRTIGFGPDETAVPGRPYGQGFPVKGLVTRTSVCTYLDWRWLLLPCCLIGLTAGQLVWVIVALYHDRREPVWKSNVLPLLFHGAFNAEMRQDSEVSDDRGTANISRELSAMEAEAKKMKVQLKVSSEASEKLGFVGVSNSSGSYSMDSLLMTEQPPVDNPVESSDQETAARFI